MVSGLIPAMQYKIQQTSTTNFLSQMISFYEGSLAVTVSHDSSAGTGRAIALGASPLRLPPVTHAILDFYSSRDSWQSLSAIQHSPL